MRCPPRHTRRSGFTLVELLVVIVIIGVLSALLLPAITGAMRTAKNATVTGEINTLAQALAAFKEKYGDYPPSRILLSENGHYPASLTTGNMVASANGTAGTDVTYAALAQRSMSYLRKFWPRMAISTGVTPQWGPTSTEWYDFDGDGVFDSNPYILEGDECLTFFLGGVPLNTGTAIEPKWSMSGWGRSPKNPWSNNLNNVVTVPSNTMYNGNRTGALFEFKNERLRDLDDATDDPVRFPSYHDALATDTPIVYFSAYGSEGYDPNDVNWGPLNSSGVAVPEEDDNGAGPLLRQFRVSAPVVDSSGAVGRISNSAAPNPYSVSLPSAATVQWHKGQSFQLLSAGADGQWGPGGAFDPAAAIRLPANPPAEISPDIDRARERDNLANFAGGPLD